LSDKSDGMETTECNGGISPAGFKLHDGRLMFPTMKGVAVIDPKALKASSSSFYPIFLEELVVDGQPLQFNSSLVLPATAHRIEFRYAALNYSHPEKVKYRCMVVGFDKNWVDCESHRSVFYTNIPYGDYVFKVMASNESGQWSEASSLSVKFNITSPFYRTYGFYLLVSLILFLLLFNGAYNFIGRYQRNRLELLVAKRTDELEQKMVIQEQMRKELEVTNHDLVVAKEKAEESDRLKGAFLANMSHEIRTPMNGILGFSELLDDEELSASDRKKFLGIISRNGKQLLTVINDILDISKLDFNQLILSKTSFNINMLLDSLFLFIDKERLRLGKSGIRIELEKGVEDDKCIIFTDEMRFTQILNNLVGNALKFTNTGIIKIGYRPEGENLLFFVQDTGKGIAIDKQEIIFDRFRQEEERDTRTFGGTGLGLSISKGLVELLGGTIWVVSEPGQGSVFYFTVPGFLLKQPLVPKSVVNPVKIVPDFKGRKILIVEDVYSNFELIEFIIHKSHPEIIYAEDGMKAIACCHSDPEIELILMDIRMPVMDGYEATREIRKFRPDIPIIALTAHAFTEEKIRSIEAGCNDFISKPIEKDKLMAVLIRFLNDKLY
ncbi:MAG: ATP-binding protein, partial [Bacteroidota bacterium]